MRTATEAAALVERIKAAAAANPDLSHATLASRFGVSRRTVTTALSKATLKGGAGRRSTLSAADVADIVRRFFAGDGAKAIAATYGITPQSVYLVKQRELRRQRGER